MSDSSDYEDYENESDAELQEALASGRLKPGLNIKVDPKSEPVNNVDGLKQKLRDIQQSFKWIERLDLTNGLAPIAPEMAVYIAEKQDEPKNNSIKQSKSLDPTLDDFKREMDFHRQAQATVLEGIPKLHNLGIRTKRPDDYFAQMAKSDDHMQKVRDSLLKKKAGLEVSEKVRKARENRKMMKQLQTQSQLKRIQDKKELIDEVKKYRKGIRKDLDFLEPGSKKKVQPQRQNIQSRKASEKKRQHKDEKYGLGGKKRGMKRNTKESAADVSDYRHPKNPKNPKNKSKNNNQRAGKNKRNNGKRRK